MADIDDTIDVHCLDDFLPTMPSVSGRTALVHRLVRRLTTKTGRFPFWKDFGFDLRDALLSKASPGFITSQVQIECLKDEQVATCSARLQETGRGAFKLTISLTDASGPFEFTMDIHTATQELNVKIQEAA